MAMSSPASAGFWASELRRAPEPHPRGWLHRDRHRRTALVRVVRRGDELHVRTDDPAGPAAQAVGSTDGPPAAGLAGYRGEPEHDRRSNGTDRSRPGRDLRAAAGLAARAGALRATGGVPQERPVERPGRVRGGRARLRGLVGQAGRGPALVQEVGPGARLVKSAVREVV